MRKRQINTNLWYDDKILASTWIEKTVWLHLLLRKELMTVGVIVTNPESVAALLSGDTARNTITPELPRIKPKHVAAAIRRLGRRGLIVYENRMEWTIFFPRFLRYQDWGPTVVKSWPGQLAEIPSRQIRGLVVEACRAYCKTKCYEIPAGFEAKRK